MKIKSLEMSNVESETKLEKMKNEYMVDISSKNDLLERLRPYETRNLTFSGMIDTPYFFVLND